MIDEKEFVQSVRDIAKAKHTFVYKKLVGSNYCLYAHDGEPSCLIGCALFDCGVTIQELKEFDNADTVDSRGADTVLSHLGLSDEVCLWATAVQSHQDSLTTWGEAVWLADIEVKL